MSGDRIEQEPLAEVKPGTRKYFYGSIGLLLAGLLLLAVGAIYSSPGLVGIGLLGWVGAGFVFLRWLLHKIG
jgi:hypothetical protein